MFMFVEFAPAKQVETSIKILSLLAMHYGSLNFLRE